MKSMQGFNFVELVITTTIVIIFAAIAVPSYLDFSRRDYYSGIISVVAPYKEAVAKCYEMRSTLEGCNGGIKPIPANITLPKENVASLVVKNGVINIVPVKGSGITAEDTYQLTPSIVSHEITWATSGVAMAKGYVE